MPATPAMARRNDVALAFCWAHARRQFFELAKAGNSPTAAEGLKLIGALYVVEDSIHGHAPDDRRAARQLHSRPVTEALHRLLVARLGQASAKSKLADAIRYASTRWTGLTPFLDEGRIDLDNNVVERAIRPLALNRKNAPFAGSDDGDDHWAVIASLIETASSTRSSSGMAHRHPRQARRRTQQLAPRRAHAVELHPHRGVRTSLTIVELIIKLGETTDVGIVAEGVENAEQVRLLIEMRCSSVRGNFPYPR